MKRRVLIVEDEALAAHELKLLLTKAGYTVCGIVDSVQRALEIIVQKKPDMVLTNIMFGKQVTGVDLAIQLTALDIPFIYLIDNYQESIVEKVKASDPYGFIVKPFREKDLIIMLEVAFYRHQNSRESILRRAETMKGELQNIVASAIGWQEKLLQIAAGLQQQIPFDFLTISVKNIVSGLFSGIKFLRIGFNEYQVIGMDNLLQRTRLKLSDVKKLQDATITGSEIAFFNGDQFVDSWSKYPFKKEIAMVFELESMLLLPIHMKNGEILSFSFYSRKADCYSHQHYTVANNLQAALESAMNIIVPVENFAPATPLENSTERVPSTRAGDIDLEGIIGKSHQMLTVLDYVSTVAPMDTSVLILGESGTGKEKVAKSIHHLSPRKNHPFITIDCTSLPSNLVESLLFGHEKGSFTDALEKRIGKFEQANNGTIFLDEIGELPLELQVKLLRVLQEKEIERIGGKTPIKVNVRIIAATNRNLTKEISEGNFRMDLYYRLNTFPITIPPLRDRAEDIPDLANFFIEKYSRKIGKKVKDVSSELLKEMMDSRWPGNIRELEHYIERGVLLSSGSMINDFGIFSHRNKSTEDIEVKTIEENERDHILKVLKMCKGRVAGAGGAAQLLNVPSTTLNSKMKKLGIKKDFI